MLYSRLKTSCSYFIQNNKITLTYKIKSIKRQIYLCSICYVINSNNELHCIIGTEFSMPMFTLYWSLTVPFPSAELAKLAFEVLNVDKEVKRSHVTRKISVEGSDLEILFYGNDLKWLRVALNGILRNIILVAKTIEQFKN